MLEGSSEWLTRQSHSLLYPVYKPISKFLKKVPAPIKVLTTMNRFHIILTGLLCWHHTISIPQGVDDGLNLWKLCYKGRSICPNKTTQTGNWPIKLNPLSCALSMAAISVSLSYFTKNISTWSSMKAWIMLNYCIVLLIVTTTCRQAAIVLSAKQEGCSSIHYCFLSTFCNFWYTRKFNISVVQSKKYLE